ncbi:putative nuclease HARBI1 [Nibea albiflora]|uniref:Nuclease HARBI1 n=1 Tax=Nibea albiflora TaxID=240163 RepID=A0ACB7EQN3_NIBAL|nr:putative nuclease HARBI1 [Nibea albiflora]
MAIPIAILDCDLLLHGRGHKTLDRFDLDSVSDHFLLTQFGFPREFILYLVELLREDFDGDSGVSAFIAFNLKERRNVETGCFPAGSFVPLTSSE